MSNIITGGFTSIEQATSKLRTVQKKEVDANTSGVSFGDILNQKKDIRQADDYENASVNGLKFSKHAGQRLEQRDIKLTNDQIIRLNEGAKKASLKGIKESLVLMDNLAFIINTGNNTVVTAMNQGKDNENIYTNIDGAVII